MSVVRLLIALFLGARERIAGISDWHVGEANRLQNSIWLGVVIPFFLMVIATFLGGWWSWNAKAVALTVAMVVEFCVLVWLGARRFVIGTELEWLVGGANFTRGAVGDAVTNYVRLLSAVVASEIAAGFIMLLIPAHVNPVLALLLVPATMGLVTYALWQGGITSWPNIVYWLAAGTFLVVVPTLWFQYLFGYTPETVSAIPPALSRVAVAGTPIDPALPGALDHASAWRIGSMSAGQVAFNAIFVLLFAATTLSRLTGIHAIRRGTLSFLAFVLVMVLANWLFWRGGIDDVRKAVDEVSARSAAAAAPRTISLDWCNDRIRAAADGEIVVACSFDLKSGEEAGPFIVVKGTWAFCFDNHGIGYHEVSCVTATGERYRGQSPRSMVCADELKVRTIHARHYNLVVHKGVDHEESLCKGRALL